MHRQDDVSLGFLIDKRLAQIMSDLLGEEPYAVQTMLYFKPPERVAKPFTKISISSASNLERAWQLGWRSMPATKKRLPASRAGHARSSGALHHSRRHGAELYRHHRPTATRRRGRACDHEPGDVLFFNGSVIHGSFPNTSKDRFRRGLIGHYIVAEAEKVAVYHPVLRMDGSVLQIDVSEGGGPCGVFKQQGDETFVPFVGHAADATMRHG